MVVRRKKKSPKKYRGSRTHGGGSHKNRRGAGNRGGRGMAGSHKHKWFHVIKYMPDHFGKRGFNRPPKVVEESNTINVGELDALADKLLEEGIAEKDNDKIIIDVTDERLKPYGGPFDKVLGGGHVKRPIVVVAPEFTERAVKKLEEAGGEAREV
ncbi:uL15m family ribosomal protein [Methanopyrus sp.]